MTRAAGTAIPGILCATAFFFCCAAASPQPVTTPVEIQKLLADDGAKSDWFGHSVAVDGDTAIIGAQGKDDGDLANTGAAYVYIRSGDAWIQQARLLASDREANEVFGSAVDLDGDTAIIGAYGEDSSGLNGNGAAYVFTRSGNVWTEQAKLVASDKASIDYFGWSVAIDGDTAVVGAIRADHNGVADVGAAYVFARTGNAWSESAKLAASDGARLDSLGSSVAINGGMIVVGAPGEATGNTYRNGAAYVFARDGTGWIQKAKLLASDKESLDSLGRSVAIDGRTIIVGADREGDSSITDAGAVYVFKLTGTAWVEQAKLVASDRGRIHHFGRSVALDGGTALIGAAGQTESGTYRNGAAYVFVRTGNAWSEEAKLLASDKARENWFGWSVDLDGNTAVASARQKNNGVGAAYVFDISPPIEQINDLLTFEPNPSSYAVIPSNEGCPPGYNAKFYFEAQLTNSRRWTLSDLYIQVTILRNDNAVLIPAGGAFGAGIVYPVPEVDGYADRLLAPAEYVDVPFTICLRRLQPFRFEVNVLGQRLTGNN